MPGRLLFSTTADGAATSTERMRIDCRGYVGINCTPTDGLLHIQTASAGTVTSNADADELTIENSGNVGLSLLTASTGESSMYFGNPGTNGEKDGWIKYYHESHSTTGRRRNLSIRAGGAEAMLISADGVKIGTDNVAMATDNAHHILTITGKSGQTGAGAIDFQDYDGNSDANISSDSGNLTITADYDDATADSSIIFRVDGSSEKLRITSSGSLMIGTTSDGTGAGLDAGGFINSYGRCVMRRDDTMYIAKSLATGGYTAFEMRSAQTTVGSITFNSGGSSFNTTSDSRLKENVVDIDDGITRLKALKPKRFNYKTLPDVTQDGFIAHEAQEVLPYTVTGTKDEVATEDKPEDDIKVGDPIYQEMDYAKLTPLLTAALQEAIGKIEVLEEKVAVLESS